MPDVSALENPPLLLREPQVAAILAWVSHLPQDSRQIRISAEPHGGLQLANVVLVVEHRMRQIHVDRLVVSWWRALPEIVASLRL